MIRAWRFTGVASGALAIAAVTSWVAPRTVAIGVAAVAVILAIISVGVSAAVLRRKTGFDLDFLVSALWLPAMFGLVVPPLALILGAIRCARPTIGGYSTIKDGGGGRHYPKIPLPDGEGRPFGVTLLAIGLLWPVAAIGLVLR